MQIFAESLRSPSEDIFAVLIFVPSIDLSSSVRLTFLQLVTTPMGFYFHGNQPIHKIQEKSHLAKISTLYGTKSDLLGTLTLCLFPSSKEDQRSEYHRLDPSQHGAQNCRRVERKEEELAHHLPQKVRVAFNIVTLTMHVSSVLYSESQTLLLFVREQGMHAVCKLYIRIIICFELKKNIPESTIIM